MRALGSMQPEGAVQLKGDRESALASQVAQGPPPKWIVFF